MFHRLSKHLEFSQKCSAACRIFELSSRCLDFPIKHCFSCLICYFLFLFELFSSFIFKIIPISREATRWETSMATCTAICQVCACAEVITYRGISWVARQTKCTQFTSTETLSFGMEITTIHLELWKVRKLSAILRAKPALRAKLVALPNVINAGFCCTTIVIPPGTATPLPAFILHHENCDVYTNDWAFTWYHYYVIN